MILELPHNPVPVYYQGGDQIQVYRGVEAGSALLSPEDWIGSTTAAPFLRDGKRVGLSTVSDGRSVGEVLSADRHSWLGSGSARAEVDFLLKLLNPTTRIPVHWHPDVAFAQAHLGLTHGKAEAWIILSDSATVWLGFRHGTDHPSLLAAIEEQDADWMLGQMHEVELSRGDTVLVPPGLVHAIDVGALIAEIQEPTSVSILAEHTSMGVDAERAALYAGWDEAFGCLLDPSDRSEALELVGHVPDDPGRWRLFPEQSRTYFQSDVINIERRATVPIDRLSAVLIDQGPLRWTNPTNGETVTAPSGSSWLLGAQLGDWDVEGDGRLLLFTGPVR
jgi:mannose-6-phosphate isomerase